MSFWSIVIAVLVLGFLVFSHELGHFIFAKKTGIGVTEFSIGMGPRLFHFTKGETMYSLKAIPFGGSCAMVGEDTDSEEDNSFQKKSVWARILVVFGGPLFNFILAFILGAVLVAVVGINPPKIYSITPGFGAEKAGIQVGDELISVDGTSIHTGQELYLYLIANPLEKDVVTVEYERDGVRHETELETSYTAWRYGISYYDTDDPPITSAISEGGAAEAAGLKVGDKIVSLNGTAIATGSEIHKFFENVKDGETVTFTYERDGRTYTTEVTPSQISGRSLGLEAYYYREDGNFGQVLKGGFDEMRYGVKSVFASLKMLFTGRASVKDMAGPVGIISIVDTAIDTEKSSFKENLMNIISLMVLLSTNLGILNLLPIPALDGGRLLFLIIEAVTGKRIPPDKEGLIHMIGFVLLMILMVFVLFNDITRLFH